MQFLSWAKGFHTQLSGPPTRALRPINSDNARPLRITAAAGTELAGAFYYTTFLLVSRTNFYSRSKEVYNP